MFLILVVPGPIGIMLRLVLCRCWKTVPVGVRFECEMLVMMTCCVERNLVMVVGRAVTGTLVVDLGEFQCELKVSIGLGAAECCDCG